MMHLVDIDFRLHNEEWRITIQIGELTVMGTLTERDMLRIVRGQDVSLKDANAFGHAKDEKGKTVMLTSEALNLRKVIRE